MNAMLTCDTRENAVKTAKAKNGERGTQRHQGRKHAASNNGYQAGLLIAISSLYDFMLDTGLQTEISLEHVNTSFSLTPGQAGRVKLSRLCSHDVASLQTVR